MQIKIDLSRVKHFPELALRYDEELDDSRSIISDICEALADTCSVDFIVSAFGQERWPVDVRTDLPVFFEQLPDALAAVEAGSSFSLDFYEQGVERFVHFELKGEQYSARCESHTGWRPEPAVETIDRMELKRMFSDVREGLMEFLFRNAGRVAAHPWMQQWAGTGRAQ
jgi:hypothetical protein